MLDQLIGEPPESPDTPKIDTGAMLQYDTFDEYLRNEGSHLTPDEIKEALMLWDIVHP